MEEFKYLIPEESEDTNSLNVEELRQIEHDLRDIFSNHHYTELMLPTFEYGNLYDGIEVEEDRIFQFTNREGKRIALRADFTVPIARLYHSTNDSEIKRYSYFGKVFRRQERHKGRSSEKYQAGIELMGLEGLKGDKECLQLIEETLKVIPLSHIKLELGSARFFNRLVELVGDKEIIPILDKKGFSMMKEYCDTHDISLELETLLLKLLQSFGGIKELQSLKPYVYDKELLLSIQELEDLYNDMNNEDILFDLCMVPWQSYYTGMMVKGYSYYCARPILTGGRYDRLFQYFNTNTPSVGFSYLINNVLTAMDKESESHD